MRNIFESHLDDNDAGRRVLLHIIGMLLLLLMIMSIPFILLIDGMEEQRNDILLLRSSTLLQSNIQHYNKNTVQLLFDLQRTHAKRVASDLDDLRQDEAFIDRVLEGFRDGQLIVTLEEGTTEYIDPQEFGEALTEMDALQQEWHSLKEEMAPLDGHVPLTLQRADIIKEKANALTQTQHRMNDILIDDFVVDGKNMLFNQKLFWLVNFCWFAGTLWYAVFYIALPLSESTKQLRSMNEQMKAIYNSAFEGILSINPSGIILSCNKEAERIFGYSAEEMEGNNVNMLMPEPYRGEHGSYLDNYMRTGEAKIIGSLREVEGLHKDGHTFPLELGLSEIKHGSAHIFVGMVRDISERKRTDEALRRHHDELQLLVEEKTRSLQQETQRLKSMEKLAREKQQFLDSIIENIPLAIFAKNAKDNYRWVLWNRKAEELFQLQAEGVLGKVDYDFFPKEEADSFRATDIKVMSEGPIIVPSENVTTKRGTWVARTIKVPIYDENGDPDTMLGILEDITEANAKEEKLKLYASKLEVQREHLIEAKKTAEQANLLKSEFLANMSHELRTPMHSIITFSRQGIERIDRWSTEEQAENLQLIKNSGERLLRLINDLLDLSKLEAGKVDYHFTPQNMAELVHIAMNELQGLIAEKHLHIKTLIPATFPPVACDHGKILQTLINLLSNAVKFTPAEKAIHIQLGYTDGTPARMELRIEDEGVGIPEDELEHVFDKFIQSSKTKTGAGGTGLGLAICREIVMAHHGEILAKNNPTGGAILVLRLPFTQPQEGDSSCLTI